MKRKACSHPTMNRTCKPRVYSNFKPVQTHLVFPFVAAGKMELRAKVIAYHTTTITITTYTYTRLYNMLFCAQMYVRVCHRFLAYFYA